LHSLDYLVIFIFTFIILAAGLSFRNQKANLKTYFAAGGAMPWSISSLSLFMSFFSAGTFVVWGSIAYEYGMVAISIQLTMCLGGLLVGYLIAPAWRKTGSLTAAEFIRNRLGKKTQQFYTYLVLFISLGYTGAFLYPVARIINVSTGWSITGSIIGLGLLIILYTAAGGLWAVVITDVLQFVVLLAAVLIVVPLALERVGGFASFADTVPADFFHLTNGEYTWTFLLAFSIYNGIFIGGNWAYVQRYTSVKDANSARKVGYLFSLLYLVSPFIWMIPPMLYRAIGSDLSGLENEGAYLLMCEAVLPAGMIGLMLGGMIFATASSVNTTLNLASAIFTNDLFKIFKPQASEKQVMSVARMATVIFGLGTIGVALLVPAAGGIVEVVLSIGAVTGCSLYGPPVWALFSKRHTATSILVCTLVSLCINLFFKFGSPLLFDFSLDRSGEMLLGALLPFSLLAAYEFYAWARHKISDEYLVYVRMLDKQNVDHLLEDEAQSEQENSFGLKVLSYTLSAIGLLVGMLGVIANSNEWPVAGMGLLILLAGQWIGRSRKTQILNSKKA
jgi:SSS family transporter